MFFVCQDDNAKDNVSCSQVEDKDKECVVDQTDCRVKILHLRQDSSVV